MRPEKLVNALILTSSIFVLEMETHQYFEVASDDDCRSIRKLSFEINDSDTGPYIDVVIVASAK